MNRKFATMAAVLGLSLTLGCATPGWAQTFMENPRFLRSGPVLGLTENEVVEKIGLPLEKGTVGSCTVPFVVDEEAELVLPAYGSVWMYNNEGLEHSAALAICFINGYAVAVHREFSQSKDRVIYSTTEEIIDLELIRKALGDELDDSSMEDRRPPIYDGPEYEI